MASLRQEDILAAVWRACDTFRGAVDATQYKDYVLTALFLKYISDVRRKHIEEFRREYYGDDLRIQRRLDRERFKIPTVPPRLRSSYVSSPYSADKTFFMPSSVWSHSLTIESSRSSMTPGAPELSILTTRSASSAGPVIWLR